MCVHVCACLYCVGICLRMCECVSVCECVCACVCACCHWQSLCLSQVPHPVAHHVPSCPPLVSLPSNRTRHWSHSSLVRACACVCVCVCNCSHTHTYTLFQLGVDFCAVRIGPTRVGWLNSPCRSDLVGVALPTLLPYLPRYDFGRDGGRPVKSLLHWHAHDVASVCFTSEGTYECM